MSEPDPLQEIVRVSEEMRLYPWQKDGALEEARAIFRAIIDGNGVNQTRYYEILKWLRKHAEKESGDE